MDTKTGADHLAELRDGRIVRIDGRTVSDVTTDPAFPRRRGLRRRAV